MIHPHTELRFINEEKGYGVVATQFIPRGTITWAYDPLDRIFSESQIKQYPPEFQDILNKYCYRDHQGQFVLCWDNARFVNHSFQSNCISTAYNLELAVRDIYPGEELTDDYGYLNVTEPLYFPREKGSSRSVVMPDDLLHYYLAWDAQLKFAFRNYNRVKQPLAFLIEQKFRKKVNDVAAGKVEMDSILNCYFPGSNHKTIAA